MFLILKPVHKIQHVISSDTSNVDDAVNGVLHIILVLLFPCIFIEIFNLIPNPGYLQMFIKGAWFNRNISFPSKPWNIGDDPYYSPTVETRNDHYMHLPNNFMI